MPVAKIRGSGAANAMRSDAGNDSIDTFIRQAIGKEPLLSFPRMGDNPVQWIQLLNALDHQDLPGWPLLTPLKVQMQKCGKCFREFCSPINYRRHIRMHRRSLNVDKESHKNRDFLGEFWDKLSLEEAKDVVSFDDVSMKEVSGSSVVTALATSLRKPGVWTLPQVYVKAGSILLDIIQAKSSRLPISSPELFSILDDASERTFLCAGTAESVQRYVIVGEAEKALELKNLVACASLLFEQKLVTAWLADKDAEALRCQKLLVEEEEAAQKRQAKLLERKKQKKLRQKEQKEREHLNSEKADIYDDSADEPVSAETSIPLVLADFDANYAHSPEDLTTSLEQIQFSSKEIDEDVEAQFNYSSDYPDMDSVQKVESRAELGNGRQPFAVNRWQVPKTHRSGRNSFHGNLHLQPYNLEPMQKQSFPKDKSSLVNGGKVWTRKPKVENDVERSRPKFQNVAANQMDKSNCELIIGSISVPVRNCIGHKQHSRRAAPFDCKAEPVVPEKDSALEKILESEAVQCGTNQAVTKLWRPVSHSEPRAHVPVLRVNRVSEDGVRLGNFEDRTSDSEICLQSTAADMDDSNNNNGTHPLSGGNEQPEGLLYSNIAAKAFLAQRWKEAILADHMKLVLSRETAGAGPPDWQNDSSAVSPSDNHRVIGVGAPLSSSCRNAKARIRMKPEKGVTKIKYIPKQKVAT